MERKRPTRFRPKYVPKRKVCPFCTDKSETIDYKSPSKLIRYISNRAKIEPRRKIGTCAKHQHSLALAIKRARYLALLPYITAHVQKTSSIDASD